MNPGASAVADFYRNKVMREEVKAYIDAYIADEAVRMVFDRKDVSHLADAKELVDKVFDQMSLDFEVKVKKDNLNEAR
jgi:hypothetical protein